MINDVSLISSSRHSIFSMIVCWARSNRYFECEDTRFFRWTTHLTMTHSIEKSAHYELDMMLASCARTRAQSICRSIIYASYKRVSVTIVNSPNTNSTPSYCSLHYLHYVYVCVCVFVTHYAYVKVYITIHMCSMCHQHAIMGRTWGYCLAIDEHVIELDLFAERQSECEIQSKPTISLMISLLLEINAQQTQTIAMQRP